MEVSLVLIDSKSRVTMIDSLTGNRQQPNTDRMIALQQQQQQQRKQELLKRGTTKHTCLVHKCRRLPLVAMNY